MVDQQWIDSLDRLAVANAREEKRRLQALTLEESGRLFEELCRVFHAEFSDVPLRKERSAGLAKYWNRP